MSLKLTKPDSICPVSYPGFFLSVYIVLLTMATFCFVLFCVICMFCVLVVLVRLSVPVQVIDWKRLVSETTYNVLTLTLDPTHSLTHNGGVRDVTRPNYLFVFFVYYKPFIFYQLPTLPLYLVRFNAVYFMIWFTCTTESWNVSAAGLYVHLPSRCWI